MWLKVDFGISNLVLRVPEFNPIQKKVVLLSLLNSGLLTRSEVADALHLSTVFVDKNHYSVPGDYAGLKVHVNIYIDRIEVFYEGKKITMHKRVFGNNKKDFITVLLLYRDYPANEIRATIELSLENYVSTSAGVKHILLHSGPDTDQSIDTGSMNVYYPQARLDRENSPPYSP